MALRDSELEEWEFIGLSWLTEAREILSSFISIGKVPVKRRFIFFGRQDPYAAYSKAVEKLMGAAPYLNTIFGYDLQHTIKKLQSAAVRATNAPPAGVISLRDNLTKLSKKYSVWPKFLTALIDEINLAKLNAQKGNNPKDPKSLKMLDNVSVSLNKFEEDLRQLLKQQRSAKTFK